MNDRIITTPAINYITHRHSGEGRNQGVLRISEQVGHFGNAILNRPAHKNRDGFTLVEVIFAILLLGIMVVSITGVYFSAQSSLHAEENLVPLDSRLRGRMEEIISRSFDAITAGSESVIINGQSHTITWTVTQPDLDGDSIPESIAKEVTVSTGNRSLTTLVIDSQGVVGKYNRNR